MRVFWLLVFLGAVWAGCSEPRCGDGIIDTNLGEQCDDGNDTNGDGCQVNCLFPGCGDGILSLGEQCDDGNSTNNDGCELDCTFSCLSTSDCNDDSVCTTDACVSNRCQFEAVNPDDNNPCTVDSCDPASGISNEPENDGVACTQPGGEFGFCLSASCEAIVCGDGFASTGEECDDGNNISSDACTNVCQSARCGDGFILSGTEECDDGNNIDADGCQADCLLPLCGDGVVDSLLGENCDDGNDDNSDACPSTCELATCGDGFLQQGTESCDDGNTTNEDTCLDSCIPNSCGDGFLNPESETCDDGNLIDTDSCLTNCTPNYCGDGIVNILAEDCDDGNLISNDGCEPTCSFFSILQIAAGKQHTCVLLDSGNIRCWGSGLDGRLGYGNINNIGDNETPASAGDVNVGGSAIQIAAGDSHTCALLSTGNVRCWGSGFAGKLGYGNGGNVGNDETPASAGDVNVGAPVIQITAGGNHTCALLNNGAVRCWGLNNFSQLGYGNINNIGDNETPASAGDVNLGGSAIQIAAGDSHTCALLSTGNVRCWGGSLSGQLGYGNGEIIGDNETPASAGDVNVGAPVIQLAAGNSHTCALLNNGAVRCWGNNTSGQLGYGNTNSIGDNETPSSIGDINLGGSVVKITAGGQHTCALLDTGNIRCWGHGNFGQLGYGNTNNIGDNETPASAGDVNVGGSVVKITAGGQHTCALLDTGNIRCWGSGNFGELGIENNDIGDNEPPASAGDVNTGGSAVQITASGEHTCALLNTGNVRCWGSSNSGQLGYGNLNNIGDNETPASAGDINLGGSAIQITTGGTSFVSHTCALLFSGSIRCWGNTGSGQLGYGNQSFFSINQPPASAGDVNVGGSAIQITAGSGHTCALLDTSNVRCWGSGEGGQLGYGNTTRIGDNETPASAGDVNVGGPVVQITAGGQHTCALLDTGNVRCWGVNNAGELGYGHQFLIGDNETPVSAGDVTVGGSVVQITAGDQHTCALLDTGNVRCWGGGSFSFNFGQLGYGNITGIGDNETPASAGDVNVGGPVVQITAGSHHTCALLDTGNVRCWGNNTSGQLGYGNTNSIGDNETPASAGDVNVGGSVVQITAGSQHTCALLDTGNVRCWGSSTFGQLGYGLSNIVGDNETPASISDIPIF